MKATQYARRKKGTAPVKINADADAVSVNYALLIAKAAALVRQRQKQYASNRGTRSAVQEPRNGILAGFAAR